MLHKANIFILARYMGPFVLDHPVQYNAYDLSPCEAKC